MADGLEAVVSAGDISRTSFGSKLNFSVMDIEKDEVRDIENLLRARFEGKEDLEIAPGDPDVLVSAHKKHEKILKMLYNANHQVEIATSILSDKSVMSAIKAKIKDGVKVKVILNDNKINRESAKELEEAGAEVRFSDAQAIGTNYINVDNKKMMIDSGDLHWTSLREGKGIGLLVSDYKVIRKTDSSFDLLWAISAIDQSTRNISLTKKRIDASNAIDWAVVSTMLDRAKYGVKISFMAESVSGKNIEEIVKKVNKELKDLAALNPKSVEEREAIAKAYGLSYNPDLAVEYQKHLNEVLSSLPDGDALVTFKAAATDSIKEEFIEYDGMKMTYKDLVG